MGTGNIVCFYDFFLENQNKLLYMYENKYFTQISKLYFFEFHSSNLSQRIPSFNPGPQPAF
jgi:hypothetical protein